MSARKPWMDASRAMAAALAAVDALPPQCRYSQVTVAQLADGASIESTGRPGAWVWEVQAYYEVGNTARVEHHARDRTADRERAMADLLKQYEGSLERVRARGETPNAIGGDA